MSYLVLARKWRPKRFAELVGQEHVVRALSNALDTGRVHHAFLFTGTRGVGKTTIARIFAKSLNCERGTSADPCGECNSCRDIDAGRFIDLLEIDAASNTGVDDVREVIDNAQYMPSRGRVKVYLIDEVHMLSKNAFNALLKTLEEPPGHVKFLLATTDPQKLPVTVLSRCLQFNLKRLDEAQIQGQMTRILAAEDIPAEPGAIRQLARSADGSLRDGLSLLDQAIAYAGAVSGGAPLTDAAVTAMLGSVDHARVGTLLEALAAGDGAALMAEVSALAEFSPDWASVLDAVAEALHRIQVRQLVPGAEIDPDGVPVDALAAALRPEVVQLWYQMALHGRRDLALAPSTRAGFEMSVLRMLAFRPAEGGGAELDAPTAAQPRGPAAARAALEGAGRHAPSHEAAGRAPAPALSGASSAGFSSARSSSSDVPASGAPSASASTAAPAEVPAAVRRPPPVNPFTDAPAAAPAVHTPEVRASAASEAARATDAPFAAPAGRTPVADVAAATPRVQPTHIEVSGPPGPRLPAVSLPAASPPAASPVVGTAQAPALRIDHTRWLDLVAACELRGPARELAAHAAFLGYAEGVLRLSLSPDDDHLRLPSLQQALADALEAQLGAAVQLKFETGRPAEAETLHQRDIRQRDARQTAAEEAFMAHPDVRRMIEQHGARVVPDSIRPIDD